MSGIKTRIQVGDSVWWVHCTGRVYDGVVEALELCEYQGAIYCILNSPSFRLNPHPCVHYSNVFLTREEAIDFAHYSKLHSDELFPMCMGCNYHYDKEDEEVSE